MSQPLASPERPGPASNVPAPPKLSPSEAPPLQLTVQARWLLGTACLFVVCGFIFDRPLAAALGGLPAVLLGWAWTNARTAMAGFPERAHLTVGNLDLSRAAQSRSKELRMLLGRVLVAEVHCDLGDARTTRDATITPAAVSPSVATVEGSGSHRILRFTPSRVGDAWIQGFYIRVPVGLGMFQLTAFVPSHLRVTVLPKHYPLRQQAPLTATRSSLQEQAGAVFSRRRGMSLEIRELRDHAPGDPFKHIAWRATARRGKLISRDFESDLVLSTFVVVDASPSMFWGTPGTARIDYAVEVAYNVLSAVVGRGFKAGLLVADDKVRLSVPLGAGRGHLPRLVEALLEIPALNHADRTEITERELAETVARWFKQHRDTSLLLPSSLASKDPRDSGLDEARLVAVARDELARLLASRTRRQAVVPLDDYARDAKSSVLRAFCRYAGLPLPLDPTPKPSGQARGLENALHEVIASRGGPHTVIVISDFYSADDLDTLRRVALACRRRRHSLVVFCPWDPNFERGAPLPDKMSEAILEVARLRVNHNLEAAQALLRPAGVRFLRCSPHDVVPRLLERLRHVA